MAYCGLENEMHVAYATADIDAPGDDIYRIVDRVVKDKTAGPRVKIHEGDADQILQIPAIAGTKDGRCLAAWRYQKNMTEWDIAARRITPYLKTYLPTILH